MNSTISISSISVPCLASLEPDLGILFLGRRQVVSRQEHRSINHDRQAPVPPSKHNGTQNQLTHDVPASAEAVIQVWQADADSDAAIGRHDFEDDVEGRIVNRVAFKGGCLGDADEQDCQDDPPEIMGQLRSKLLPHKVAFRVWFAGLIGHPPLQPTHEAIPPRHVRRPLSGLLSRFKFLFLCLRIVCIHTQAAFFVHVRVAHRDHHRIDRNVHHQHVENEKADTKVRDGYDVEAPGSHSQCLEETVKSSRPGWETFDRRVANLKSRQIQTPSPPS